MRIGIVDDEDYFIQMMINILKKKISYREIISFTDPYEFFKVRKDHSFDLVFMDVDLGVANGVDLVDQFGSHKDRFIMMTDYSDYVDENHNRLIIGRVPKPFSHNEVDKYVYHIKYSIKESILDIRKEGREELSINSEEILYIVSYYNHYSVITSDKLFNVSKKEFREIGIFMLKHHGIKVNQSYYVNLNHVDMIENSKVVMDNGDKIDVGRTYKRELELQYEKYKKSHN